MNLRHGIYVLLAVVGLVWTWSQGIQWIQDGGNLLNLPSFFINSYRSGSAAAFLTVDIAIAWATFIIWAVNDSAKIGLGGRTGWAFVALSFLGTCFAFPLYLVVRERHLTSAKQSSIQ